MPPATRPGASPPARPSTRPPGALPARLVALTVLLVGALLVPLPAAAATSDPSWGILSSTCSSSDIAANRSAGLTTVETDAYWDRFVPSQAGVVNTDYVNDLVARVTACLDAGFQVVVGTGTQYPPSWVRSLTGARYVDQRGRTNADGAIDTVFSAAVRAAEADYLKRLVAALPASRLSGIRIGTTAYGELGFPGPDAAGDGYLSSWWAFGAAPQQGTGLAAGTPKTPMPGWIPGQKTWNGQTVTPAAAKNWFLWYSRSLVYALKFQTDTLRNAGYGGAVQFPSAGRGVLPDDLTAATNALLNGTADRDGSLERGLNYVDQFPVLAGNVTGPLVIDLTGVDDATAVTARAQNPPQDTCRSGDTTASVTSGTNVAAWSNMRFTRAQAARAGLAAVGENPGPPAPQTGGTSSSDSEAAQVARSPAYARGCALAAFTLAFESVVDDPSSGVTRADYVSAIGP